MKWIKYAVGLVIALSVIPLVVVTVNNLDTPKLKTVEFEVVDIDDIDNTSITVTDNTYNNLLLYSIVDEEDDEGTVTNLLSVKLNDLEQPDYTLWLDSDSLFGYIDGNDNSWDGFDDTNNFISDEYLATIGDKWVMTFEVSIMPPLIKLLVGFIPLLLASGILLFMLNKSKKEVF